MSDPGRAVKRIHACLERLIDPDAAAIADECGMSVAAVEVLVEQVHAARMRRALIRTQHGIAAHPRLVAEDCEDEPRVPAQPAAGPPEPQEPPEPPQPPEPAEPPAPLPALTRPMIDLPNPFGRAAAAAAEMFAAHPAPAVRVAAEIAARAAANLALELEIESGIDECCKPGTRGAPLPHHRQCPHCGHVLAGAGGLARHLRRVHDQPARPYRRSA